MGHRPGCYNPDGPSDLAPSIGRPYQRITPVRTAPLLGLGVAVLMVAAASGQDAPTPVDPKPFEMYRLFRSALDEGKPDLAAVYLQAFLDAAQDDKPFLELEKRYGSALFQQLRTIPKWSDDPVADKKAKATVEAAIARAKAAAEKSLNTPERVTKYIRNLAASYEEKVYAQQELKRTGDYAVPFMVEEYTRDGNPAVTIGLLETISLLASSGVAGWVAGLDGMKPEQQYGVLTRVAARPDFFQLVADAQTDVTPTLWKLLGQTEGQKGGVRELAEGLLGRITGADATRVRPEGSLVALGRAFYDHKAKFAGLRKNPDATDTTYFWAYDPAAKKVVKREPEAVAVAEEHFALRYARWALQRNELFEPAQSLILAVAADRGVEKARFGSLALGSPNEYALLAGAPTGVLNDLLATALAEQRTAAVLGAMQVLADRADKEAASGRTRSPGKPALYTQGLSYPDPRVQLAAAHGLLRSGLPVEPGSRGRILEILRRAAGADAGANPAGKGQALIVDPNRTRGDATALMLRGLGYDTEYFPTGRELFRRVAKASDFDLVIIDQHVSNPGLSELVAHLRADLNAARRPVLVVASADKPIPPTLDTVMLRFALLIAATGGDAGSPPPPYSPALPRPGDDPAVAAAATNVRQARDVALAKLARDRTDRLMKVIDTAGLVLSNAQRQVVALRAEQITFAVLAADFPITEASSPATFAAVGRLKAKLNAQPPTPVAGYGSGLETLFTRLERIDQDIPQQPAVKGRYDRLRAAIDPEELGLLVRVPRDTIAEARLARLVRPYAGVKVIAEPYSKIGFEYELKEAYADPAQAPRDPADKRAGAKQAVDWLKRMATGEVAGYDARSAEPELLLALKQNDTAESAADALARIGTDRAQHDLVAVTVDRNRPAELRIRAADAAARNIQTHGKATPKGLADQLAMLAPGEPNPELRAKMETLRGLIGADPKAYGQALLTFTPSKPVAAPAKGSDKPADASPPPPAVKDNSN